MDECVFCRIAKGELPCAKVWENEDYVAVLDAFPNTKGMTLVLPKEHVDSYAFDMAEEDYKSFCVAAREVAGVLEAGLGVKRVSMVMEGMGVNHAHFKLYPMHGLKSKYEDLIAEGTAYYEKYPGYVCTRMGERADFKELQALAQEIRERAGVSARKV